jgi:hypothetical protein
VSVSSRRDSETARVTQQKQEPADSPAADRVVGIGRLFGTAAG